MECCGSASYEDWYEIDWSGSGVSNTVPMSCCNMTATENCDNSKITDIYTTVCLLLCRDDDDDRIMMT